MAQGFRIREGGFHSALQVEQEVFSMVSWLRARGIQEASGYTLRLQSLGMTGVFLALGLGFGVKRLFDVGFFCFFADLQWSSQGVTGFNWICPVCITQHRGQTGFRAYSDTPLPSQN